MSRYDAATYRRAAPPKSNEPEELIAEILPPGHQLGGTGQVVELHLREASVGDAIDLIDPLRLREIPGRVIRDHGGRLVDESNKQLNDFIDQKTARAVNNAANIVEARAQAAAQQLAQQANEVTANVTKAAAAVAVGTMVLGSIAGAFWWLHKQETPRKRNPSRKPKRLPAAEKKKTTKPKRRRTR
jgi:hypothetical protein